MTTLTAESSTMLINRRAECEICDFGIIQHVVGELCNIIYTCSSPQIRLPLFTLMICTVSLSYDVCLLMRLVSVHNRYFELKKIG